MYDVANLLLKRLEQTLYQAPTAQQWVALEAPQLVRIQREQAQPDDVIEIIRPGNPLRKSL